MTLSKLKRGSRCLVLRWRLLWKLFVIAAAVGAFVLPMSGSAHETSPGETVTVVGDRPIPNLPGKRLVSLVVDYLPGASSAEHHHPRSAFIYAYVISGEIRSQVDAEPTRVYQAGEAWFESPGAHHRVSQNASDTAPARLLAIFIVDTEEKQLVTPSPK